MAVTSWVQQPICVWLPLAVVACDFASATTLAERAAESGCVERPVRVEGSTYKCSRGDGWTVFFNVPGAVAPNTENGPQSEPSATGFGRAGPTAKASKPSPAIAATGSGFSVAVKGRVITNQHVVAECTRVLVKGPGREPKAAQVVAQDQRNDLALLAVDAVLPAVATFRKSSIRLGEDVIALGFPLHGLLSSDVNLSTGIVSALAGLGDDTSKLQISAPVQPGNSGGPVLDRTAAVVGIVVQKLDAVAVARLTGDVPQNVNFAIKGEVAQVFLVANGISVQMAVDGSKEMSIADAAAKGRAFTYLVECWR